MATGSLRSAVVQPSLSATYCLASLRRMPRVICIRATRSPAARIPPMPEACAWACAIPRGSPDAHLQPVDLAGCSTKRLRGAATRRRRAGARNIGTPPTPMPALTWTGMVATSMQRLDEGDGAGDVPGERLAVLTLTAGPKMRGAGLLCQLGAARAATWPASRMPSYSSSPCMPSTNSRGHADLDADVRVRVAEPARPAQGGQEVGVPGGPGGVEVDAVGAGLTMRVGDEAMSCDEHLDGLLLGGARLGDLAQRQQLGPVLDRAVRLRVAAQVRHRAVLQRGRSCCCCASLMHLGLGARARAHGLVRVVVVPQLDHVGAVVVLVRDCRSWMRVPRSACPSRRS